MFAKKKSARYLQHRSPIKSKRFNYYLDQLKSEIKLRVLNNRQWKQSGVQLSFWLQNGDRSILGEIFDLKNHFLLLELHELIFREGHAYQDVYVVLHCVLSDLNLLDEFMPWITDPGMMMLRCYEEHWKTNETSVQSEMI